MSRLSAIPLACVLLAASSAVFASTGSAPAAPSPSTLSIPRSVPASVPSVTTPDTSEFYTALKGTHYSYRCLSPFTAPGEQAAVEVCEIPPVELQLHGWPETEVIQLISGQVQISEADGTQKHYQAGDIFVLPQGFKGIWKQPGTITKVTVRHPLYWKD
ncbi:cupin domain-containing protein [Pseudomonas muyukensis]|uniref:cupin domain-containing protein n=1 Tax=Pseudomonas muyukensis TaxID=2842357 RepID=UPI001CEC8DF8|nr:cupin domain-containing protein [Pseudomonas muyukensis]